MKKKIIRYTLCGIAIFVIVVSIGILCVNKFIQNKQESRAENYNLLAQYVFELYDEENIELEKEYLDTQFIKICEDEEIADFVDSEWTFISVQLYQEDLLFIYMNGFDYGLRDRGGYIYTRNGTIPSTDYEDYPGNGFDEDLQLNQSGDNIYEFEVGIR